MQGLSVSAYNRPMQSMVPKDIAMRGLQRLKQILIFADRYQQAVSKTWFGPSKMTAFLLIVATLAMVVAAYANSWVRANQLEAWHASQDLSFIDSAPSFSTADAPFYLRYARLIKDGSDTFERDRIRSHPNWAEPTKETERDTSIFDWPLISFAISVFSVSDNIGSQLISANIMIIVTAAVTALMITICFGATGYWTEGAVAAIGGGLCSAYLVRSSIGRIDTDQLNLGFMYLMFGLFAFAGRARSRAGALAWCVAAGLCANLFMWWYGKQELIIIAAVALAWVLVCLQRNALTAFCGIIIFLGFAQVSYFNPLTSIYFKDVLVDINFIFPNTLETVTEVRREQFGQILASSTGSVEMGIVCLAGLALFIVRHPVIAVAYGPLVTFGMLNFLIGNRAIFYSAPIMWFGAAFLITTTSRFIAFNLSENSYGLWRDQSAKVLAACLAMIIAWVNSPTDYVPRPSFSKPVLEGFASLKASADPTNSVVATWWDYGYASMLFNELPTFHDGGSHTTPSTHFVAKAFLNQDQTSTIGNLKFLSTKGHKGIAAESSLAGLQEKFGEAANLPSPDLYLVVTSQMAGWMGSISQIGNWDIEKGKPVALQGNPNGPLVNYEPLNCRLGGYPQTLSCAGTTFDLEHGLINGAPELAAWAHSQNGTTVRGKSFDHDGSFGVQIIQTGNRINVFLMHRQLFESSFNELFYLGQIDHPSISLHYDNYPHIRIYKVDGESAG